MPTKRRRKRYEWQKGKIDEMKTENDIKNRKEHRSTIQWECGSCTADVHIDYARSTVCTVANRTWKKKIDRKSGTLDIFYCRRHFFSYFSSCTKVHGDAGEWKPTSQAYDIQHTHTPILQATNNNTKRKRIQLIRTKWMARRTRESHIEKYDTDDCNCGGCSRWYLKYVKRYCESLLWIIIIILSFDFEWRKDE